MGKRKDLSDFGEDQIVMARRLGQSISKTAGLVGCSGMQWLVSWPPNSPHLHLTEHLWDVLEQQVRSMEAPPHNLQDLKDLLLTSWCQIPQDTFRGLEESMP